MRTSPACDTRIGTAQPRPRNSAYTSRHAPRPAKKPFARNLPSSTLMALTIGLILCASALAQDSVGRITSVKLLTPQAGWAATKTRLYWTNDDGLNWKDVTPSAARNWTFADTFFFDPSNGWVLLTETDEGGDSARFELASTTDGGADWSVAPLHVPEADPGRGSSSEAWVYFEDTKHGWVMVRMNGNAAVSLGILLITDDGGGTWRTPQHLGPPVAGPTSFADPKRGWLAGGPDEQLYSTTDGGETWQEVSLPAPPPMRASAAAIYHLPTFQSAGTASLPVEFFQLDGEKEALALFRSADGGQNWTRSGVLQLDHSSWATSVADSSWITASVSGDALALRTVPLGGDGSGAAAPVSVRPGISRSAILRVTFADNARGWVLLTDGELLFTADGGATWTQTTPSPARVPRPTASGSGVFPAAPRPRSYEHNAAPEAATDTPAKILGFDLSRVMLPSAMQAWWDLSPYFATSVYLPGSPNRGTDPNLTASWVSAIQGQGWGFIPIWFGTQAPCACAPSSPAGGCTPYNYVFSSDPATAQAQGTGDADAASRILSTQVCCTH